jgi:hypothetical protein
MDSSKGLAPSEASVLDEMGARSQQSWHWRRSTQRPTHQYLNVAERPMVCGDSRSLCQGALGRAWALASHPLAMGSDIDPGGILAAVGCPTGAAPMVPVISRLRS